jgi:hypothetical protein
MDLSGLKERINGILESIRGIPEKARGIFSKVKAPKSREESLENDESSETEVSIKPSFFSALPARFNSILNSILDRFEPEKRKPLLIGSGSLICILLILIIAAGVSSSKKKRTISPEAAPEGLTIAVEELFIPAEPDFVPEFIFEREKRRFWSLEDIRPYWRTPDSSDRWREEMKSAVDKLMEGIP